MLRKKLYYYFCTIYKMKVYLVIDMNNASTEEIYYKTDIFIASTFEIAQKYAEKCGISDDFIREVEVNKEEVSLTGMTNPISFMQSEEQGDPPSPFLNE